MKPQKELKVIREGKKRFDIIGDAIHYSGDGSYLRMSMGETMQEVFENMLTYFGIEGLKVTVSEISERTLNEYTKY